ncbi:hypothetical protein [Nocardia aurea]|uniref:hypothetical protein n=1 Tax=Nocardia aurea TaxID=2144174 RepID=UPI000D699FB0|nr:hypothetical protein [Nocardia aurea]
MYEPLPDRWMIQVSEYARIHIPHAWGGWRNPVKYATLEELRISVDDMQFEKMPEPTVSVRPIAAEPPIAAVDLTIAQARAGLTATYGVQPDAIEIIIRG